MSRRSCLRFLTKRRRRRSHPMLTTVTTGARLNPKKVAYWWGSILFNSLQSGLRFTVPTWSGWATFYDAGQVLLDQEPKNGCMLAKSQRLTARRNLQFSSVHPPASSHVNPMQPGSTWVDLGQLGLAWVNLGLLKQTQEWLHACQEPKTDCALQPAV